MEEGSVLYESGYYFGVTKVGVAETKKEKYDSKIRPTIVNVINQFYTDQGLDSILIFHCSDDWGADKKAKRAMRFEDWFLVAENKYCFKKINEDILIHDINELGNEVTEIEYLSLIIECNNSKMEIAIEQFQNLKTEFVLGKN